MKLSKPLTDKEMEEWENNRDLDAELLESVRQMKAGEGWMTPLLAVGWIFFVRWNSEL